MLISSFWQLFQLLYSSCNGLPLVYHTSWRLSRGFSKFLRKIYLRNLCKGERRERVVRCCSWFLKIFFSGNFTPSILGCVDTKPENLSSRAYTRVFSANFAAYCVKNTCHATERLRNFCLGKHWLSFHKATNKELLFDQLFHHLTTLVFNLFVLYITNNLYIYPYIWMYIFVLNRQIWLRQLIFNSHHLSIQEQFKTHLFMINPNNSYCISLCKWKSFWLDYSFYISRKKWICIVLHSTILPFYKIYIFQIKCLSIIKGIFLQFWLEFCKYLYWQIQYVVVYWICIKCILVENSKKKKGE